MNNDLKIGSWINFDSFKDQRGELYIVDDKKLPFTIKRVFHITNLSALKGVTRGGHAHKSEQQVIVPISGGFDLILDDTITKEKIHLNDPSKGILVPNKIWSTLESFLPNTIVSVYTSDYYDESDYIRDYESYISFLE